MDTGSQPSLRQNETEMDIDAIAQFGLRPPVTGPKISLILIRIVLCFLFAALPGVAQDTVTGAFQGDVSNNLTGDPVQGAAIRITSVQTGTVYDLTTDSKGRFYQGLLAPGL